MIHMDCGTIGFAAHVDRFLIRSDFLLIWADYFSIHPDEFLIYADAFFFHTDRLSIQSAQFPIHTDHFLKYIDRFPILTASFIDPNRSISNPIGWFCNPLRRIRDPYRRHVRSNYIFLEFSERDSNPTIPTSSPYGALQILEIPNPITARQF
jgi:hypothetical protein